jgi:uncharacterized membrane protein YccC
VFASWMYFIGTMISVPICGIYIHYFPDSMYFQTAIMFCLFGTFVMLVFTLACYPSSDPHKVRKRP